MPRRRCLKGAAAVGVVGAVPAILTRRALAAQGNPTVVNSIRSLSNPYHATWNKGGAALSRSRSRRRLCDAGDGGQQREGHRRHQGYSREDQRQLSHINVDPNDSPDARPIVQACKQAARLRRDAVEFASPTICTLLAHKIVGA